MSDAVGMSFKARMNNLAKELGTRPRDYYDVYMLTRLRKVRPRIFKAAVRSTFEKCGTEKLLCSIPAILDGISKSHVQEEYWRRYQQEFPYARGLSFRDVVASVRRLLKGVQS